MSRLNLERPQMLRFELIALHRNTDDVFTNTETIMAHLNVVLPLHDLLRSFYAQLIRLQQSAFSVKLWDSSHLQTAP